MKNIQTDFLKSREKVTTPCEEFDWKNKSPQDLFALVKETPKPIILRGVLKRETGFWEWDNFMKQFGEEDVSLTCPVADEYVGKVKDIVFKDGSSRAFFASKPWME